MTRRKSTIATALAALLVAIVGISPAPAQAASPAWKLSVSPLPTNFAPNSSTVAGGGLPLYEIIFTNVGGAPTTGSYTITDNLPAGITEHGSGLQTVTLTTSKSLLPGQQDYWKISVDTGAAAPAVTNHVSISGGGAPTAEAEVTSAISATPTPGGLLSGSAGLGASATDANGAPVAQAGAHPYLLDIGLQFNSDTPNPSTINASGGGPRDVYTTLPAGMIVNPSATSVLCTEADLETDVCPDASQVGTIAINTVTGAIGPVVSGLYNVDPQPGQAASFGFDVAGVGIYVHLIGGVRAGDYALSAAASDVLARSGTPLLGAHVQLWGDTTDSSHDASRGGCINTFGVNDLCPTTHRDAPLLTMPTSCTDAPSIDADVDTWTDVGNFIHRSAPLTDLGGNTAPVTGCSVLQFAPTIQARPTTNVADSPSGLTVDLHIPQTNSLNSLATAHLRKAVVTLPEGLVINPSGANGLDGCSSAQVGIDPGTGVANGNEPNCPDASKIGTVEVDTPLVPDPLPGAVYVATPHDNPFDSLLAIYVVLDDPKTGTLVKLAGHVAADPNTGRLTTTFDNNPQLPFSDFKLSFFSGSAGVLRTPATCGSYSTTSSLTPWSAPDSGGPKTPSDTYSINQGPNGSCANSQSALPHSPSFDAGTVSPVAKAFSPFVISLRRNDGSQQFSTVTVTTPPGLLGKLAGTPYCPQDALDAAAAKTGRQELANPSCPGASQIGSVEVGAGAGPAPYYIQGKAYLTGPYKGAPLSMAIVTPAAAGPYDLGTIVTRVALNLDPATAQITATSDPIPQILQGIPTDVRSATIKLDKPNFTLNGTSCDPFSVNGSLLSSLGQSASLSERFQLAECSSLPFKPNFALSLKGGTLRNGHPAATIVLNERGGDANLGKAQITLPPSMQLDQSHIKAPCTRPQFAADQCPAASVIGSVTATSPLVDYPLTGPVYLRTGENPLPDLVLDLHGPASQPVRFDVVNKIDTVNARLRATTQNLPDAPVTKAVIHLLGGGKGLLVNNTSLCKQVNRATVLLDGQNGKVADSTPKVAVKCPKAHKHKRHHKRSHRRHHTRH